MHAHLPTANGLGSNSNAIFFSPRLVELRSSRGALQTENPAVIRKLDYNGQPVKGSPRIAPVVVHKGFIYVSGQGANHGGAVQGVDIEAHTRKVMENIKRIVESGGGTMDSILKLNVFLATLEDYEAMNKVYDTYFPNGGPARMTVAVASVPGHSRLEINGIAAVVKA